jgi:hypothetical protein
MNEEDEFGFFKDEVIAQDSLDAEEIECDTEPMHLFKGNSIYSVHLFSINGFLKMDILF